MNDMTLTQLADISQVSRRLQAAGFAARVAEAKASRFADLARVLLARTAGTAAPLSAWFVPGRIEVFGKHTDYAGGRSVVAAAERGFCGAAVRNPDNSVVAIDVANREEAHFTLDSLSSPTIGSWANYPATAARRMAANFPSLRYGATVAFASDLPPAAGMSSSSALMVMTFLLLGDLNHLARDAAYRENIQSREDLAGYLGTVENGQTFKRLVGDRGVGTFGGSEDHTAILASRAGQWAQYSYCPVRLERMITAPRDHLFAIGISGIVAEKTGAARELYNRASSRASALTQLWQQATGRDDPHLAAIAHSSPHAIASLRNLLDTRRHEQFSRQELIDRWEQFVTESEGIIPALPSVIDARTLGRVGELALRSQRMGAERLGNQVPETVFLADSARQLGAAAASAQGAGFGGSVWGLVPEQEAESFLTRWSDAYRHAFPQSAERATFFLSHAGPPATPLSNHSGFGEP